MMRVTSAFGLAVPLMTVAFFLRSIVQTASSLASLEMRNSKMPLVFADYMSIIEYLAPKRTHLLNVVLLLLVCEGSKGLVQSSDDLRSLVHISLSHQIVPQVFPATLKPL